jgi:twitching motility protein PilT
LIGAFPPEEQSQIRTMVSESLRAIVSQRLVKRADGQGRIPALEILVANTAIANLIREQKTFQIPGIMQSGSVHGMCLLDGTLKNLVKAGTITNEEARINAANPKAFD